MALKRISDLSAASLPLTGTEELELDVAGVAGRCTAQDIADLATTGAEDFTDLGDVPASYTGHGGKLVAVKGSEDGLEFVAPSDVLDVQTPSNVSGTVTLDFAGKTRYVGAITLGANVSTLTISSLPGAGKFAEYELHIKQDPSTPRTFAIPASHKALGGSDTAIAAGVNVVTVLTASTVDNGTTWRYAMQESA